jgi:hypothetical protein
MAYLKVTHGSLYFVLNPISVFGFSFSTIFSKVTNCNLKELRVKIKAGR